VTEVLCVLYFNSFAATNELSRQLKCIVRHSVHVSQPYTGTTADNQLAPRQN